MTRHAVRLAAAGFCVAAAACGGPSGPTTSTGGVNSGGSGVTCRTYPSSSTITFASSTGVNASAPANCSWDNTLHQLTCTVGLSSGGGTCSTTLTSYASAADFVDEIRVIPPALLRTSDIQNSSGDTACLVPGAVQNATYAYDAQRRLTQILNGATSTTYTAWDSSGRPTQGTVGVATPVTISYDSTARTQTQTTGADTSAIATTTTFDANGTPIKVVATAAGVTTTTTTQVNQTAQVCK
jgi:YD repeat-containing protein